MTNIAASLWRQAEVRPRQTAVSGAGGRLSYAELRERCAAVAGKLAQLGIGKGVRVLLVTPNVPEFAAALRGIQAAGAIAVTVNTMSTVAELDYILGDAECTLTLAWHSTSRAPGQACARRGLQMLVLDQGLRSMDDAPATSEPIDMADDDTAVLLYTSGTTGRPKGAQITHGNLEACAAIFHSALRLSERDTLGTALPLSHIFGQGVILGAVLRGGATLSVLERFAPDAFFRMLARDHVTVAAGVPTMWNAVLHASSTAGAGTFASLRLAASGGASLPEEVLRAFSERFGCTILEGYGLTETTGAATFNGIDRARKPGRVGIALPGCEIRVVGPDRRDLGAGQVGEVLVRGPVVMKGYWGRPEATAAVLRDGWLRTGDLGEIDQDGDLRIVDRKQDLIIHGGYNVYPREVEEVLFGHPDIVEAAVVGIPDEHYGEEVGAAVVLKPGCTLSIRELRGWAGERLSAYKVPRSLLVMEALPKGPTGKVLRRAIDRSRMAAAIITERTGADG
jgi:long-chain acyl-CoA synthetase